MTLVPLSETFVRYEQGDNIGFLLAIITLCPIFLIVSYLTVIIIRRDIQTIFICCGQFLCIVLAVILKRIIAQPRPMNQLDLHDYGMPSSHSQFMSYFMICAVLQIFRIPNEKLSLFFRLIYSTFFILLCFGVLLSRIYLNYHTYEQVIVGTLIGTTFGLGWFHLTHSKMMNSMFTYICNMPLARYLLIRNYKDIEYAILEEYKILDTLTHNKLK